MSVVLLLVGADYVAVHADLKIYISRLLLTVLVRGNQRYRLTMNEF